MTASARFLPSRDFVWPKANSIALPLAAIALLIALQFSLIFSKSFNWDEFLHYNMVYQLRDGSLARPFQTLLARLLSWAPHVSDDLISQMMAARVAVWGAFVIGLCSLYGLARQFVTSTDAAWTVLAYLGAGTVFVHGFAIRTDPIAMAILMSALYLLASRQIGWLLVLGVGVLVGFAGILTVKSMFYAPCFAGVVWLRLSEVQDKRRALILLAAIGPIAVATFACVYLLHRAGLAPVPSSYDGGAFVAIGTKWLTDGLLRQPGYILAAIVTAPVFVYALIASRKVWKQDGLGRDKMIVLACFCLPLLVILFYRNVFPYFFVFICAPAAVALAPAVANLRQRFGPLLLGLAVCAIPFSKFVAEPRDVLVHQRMLVDYVHRQFPEGARSFDYCGIIADYPRVVDHLISGIGLAHYNSRGIPLVARAVQSGELAFVIDNKLPISLALAGKSVPNGLLREDVAALHGNYVRVWGNLWLAGKELPAGIDAITINIPHSGTYITDADIIIDGQAYSNGDTLELAAGRHIVDGTRARRAVLWRGDRLPLPPPTNAAGKLFTKF